MSTTVLYAVNVVSSLIMAPVIVRSFGSEAYGVWELMLSLVGYLSLLELGISPAVVRYIALARGAGDRAHLQRVFSAGAIFCLSLAVVGASILALTSFWPQLLFNAGAEAREEMRSVLLLFSLIFAFDYIVAAPVCYLLGSQRYTTVNAFRVAQSLGQTVVSYYVLSTGPAMPMKALATVTLSFAIVGLAFYVWLWLKDDEAPALTRRVPLALVGELFRFGIKSATTAAAFTLLRSGMLFVLAHVAGVGQVIFFVFPLRLVEMAQSLGQIIGIPLTPYFADALGRSGGAPPAEAWGIATRVLQFATFGIALGVAWLGLPFLRAWIGAEYADDGAIAFAILCIGLFAQCLAVNCSRILVSSGRHGRLAASALIFGSASLILAIPLVSRFGTAGAAMAWTTFSVCQSAVEIRFALSYLALRPARHFSLALARYGVPLLAGSLAFHLCRQIIFPSEYASIVAHGLVGTSAYVAACLVTAVSGSERERAWLAIRTLLGVCRRSKSAGDGG
jgi:O-antigen/teichoic acid export membrane protein